MQDGAGENAKLCFGVVPCGMIYHLHRALFSRTLFLRTATTSNREHVRLFGRGTRRTGTTNIM